VPAAQRRERSRAIAENIFGAGDSCGQRRTTVKERDAMASREQGFGDAAAEKAGTTEDQDVQGAQ
jgi:hypothetical protein